MRNYEAMVIVDARLDEGDIGKAIDRLLSTIEESGGEVVDVDRWGVRRLAFEMTHQKEGYYVVANFRASLEAVERLRRTVQIGDEYLRGKVIQPG